MADADHRTAITRHVIASQVFSDPKDIRHQVHRRAASVHRQFLRDGDPYATSGNITQSLATLGWMWEPELRWLAHHAQQSQVAVEIGSAFGRSTRSIGDNLLPGGQVFAIDSWRGSSGYYQKLTTKWGDPDARFARFSSHVADLLASRTIIPIRLDSGDALILLTQLLEGRRLDFLFIDGDHSYKICTRDIMQYRHLVKPGGVLAGHDFYQLGVFKSVQEQVGPVQVWSRIWWTTV